MLFLTFLINGISLGSVYAIMALGYTMVYGIAKMLNFAHGDIIMVGAYVVFYMITSFNLNVIVATIVAMIVCLVLGVMIEKIAYKPLRNASSLSVLITAIGVSYLLQNLALLLFSSSNKILPPVNNLPNIVIGSISISYLTIFTIFICLFIVILLTTFVNKSKIGMAMRAVSEDKDAARLMGININRTISITFAIGSALAAIASILFCAAYPAIYPTLGSIPGIKAFTAAVFGGIGSIPGAFLGGLVLGLIETLSKAYISTQLSDAIVFAILIVVLLIKPTGLLGKKKNVKV